MKNKFSKKTKSGFTLIELLVVIGIVSILAGVVFIGLGNARQRARDTKREADIMEIQWAMERYYNDNYEYPSLMQDLVDNYLAFIPKDPFDEDYNFENNLSDRQRYCIWAELERGEYLAVSEKGYGFTNDTPLDIDNCW